MWNLFKVNDKDIRTTWMTLTRFHSLFSRFIVKKVNVHWDSFYITIKGKVSQIEKLMKNNHLLVWSVFLKFCIPIIYSLTVIHPLKFVIIVIRNSHFMVLSIVLTNAIDCYRQTMLLMLKISFSYLKEPIVKFFHVHNFTFKRDTKLF